MKPVFFYVLLFFMFAVSMNTQGGIKVGFTVCNDTNVPVRVQTNVEYAKDQTLLWHQCKRFPWAYNADDPFGFDPLRILHWIHIFSTQNDTRRFEEKSSLCLNIGNLSIGFSGYVGRVSNIDVCDDEISRLSYRMDKSPVIYMKFYSKITIHIKDNKFNPVGNLSKKCHGTHVGNDNSIISQCHAPLKGASQYYAVKITGLENLKELIGDNLWATRNGFVNKCGKTYKDKHKTLIDCAVYPEGSGKHYLPGSYYKSCKMVFYNTKKNVLYAACPRGKAAITFYKHKEHWLINDKNSPAFPWLVYSISKLDLNKETVCDDIANHHGKLTCVRKKKEAVIHGKS